MAQKVVGVSEYCGWGLVGPVSGPSGWSGKMIDLDAIVVMAGVDIDVTTTPEWW